MENSIQSQPWLPQFTLRRMLWTMTLATLLAVIGSMAYAGKWWAEVLIASLAWLLIAILAHAMVFLAAYFLSFVFKPTTTQADVSPFAGESLPPQWILPEDPE